MKFVALRNLVFKTLGYSFLYIALATTNAFGLEINMSFGGGTYIDPYGVNRTNELTAITQAAADYWKDIFEHNGTIDLTYQWGNVINDGLGFYNNWTNTITLDTTLSSGASRPWFFGSVLPHRRDSPRYYPNGATRAGLAVAPTARPADHYCSGQINCDLLLLSVKTCKQGKPCKARVRLTPPIYW